METLSHKKVKPTFTLAPILGSALELNELKGIDVPEEKQRVADKKWLDELCE
jgi:hypothetical protein